MWEKFFKNNAENIGRRQLGHTVNANFMTFLKASGQHLGFNITW